MNCLHQLYSMNGIIDEFEIAKQGQKCYKKEQNIKQILYYFTILYKFFTEEESELFSLYIYLQSLTSI